MPHLHVSGTSVHYREQGSGPAVVLLHGGGSSGAQWREVCALLAPRFRMVTMDHYGHGGTDPWPGPPEARTHEAEAALVRALLARLGEPAHLVGHSYGGGVALRLALSGPEGLRSLTLIEPIALSLLREGGEFALYEHYRDFALSFQRDVAAGEVARAWENFIDGNDAPGRWAALEDSAREGFLSLTDTIVSGWHANLSHATSPAECRALGLPVLLIHGERTQPHFRRMTELLAEHIPACRQVVLPGAGHMSPLSHAQALADELAGHFAPERAI
jgi:pimeloyl-ACP methyl ester carboxylesterase